MVKSHKRLGHTYTRLEFDSHHDDLVSRGRYKTTQKQKDKFHMHRTKANEAMKRGDNHAAAYHSDMAASAAHGLPIMSSTHYYASSDLRRPSSSRFY